ncbi:SDR family NAD(P)-dependent oxidoreductase [Candidatus Entotheonella palauensis]|uniref:SDR family NAD(P)-dependent oxidoreductase n=1 Tax=Candidatus Entotheonella palauensis TaxID=93172 RepID=UPI000B7CCBCB|nr:SDR family oxidoreductase [Candidatus Entotheonella palauensis]
MTPQGQSLTGKVAVITGASRGIGKAIAIAFAQAGASVCCAARSTSDLDDVVKAIEAPGGQALAVQTDVTRLADIERMYQATADAFGGIDIVVVNAGGNLENSSIADSDPANWAATIELNLTGAYYCARNAIPYLQTRGGGKIITIGSGIGHNGRAGSSAYACAKAGLWMLTRVLAQELGPHNISVNELIPGPVLTPGATQSWSQQDNAVNTIDSEWVKEPEAVVPLALFLATQPDQGPTAQSFSLMRRDV